MAAGISSLDILKKNWNLDDDLTAEKTKNTIKQFHSILNSRLTDLFESDLSRHKDKKTNLRLCRLEARVFTKTMFHNRLDPQIEELTQNASTSEDSNKKLINLILKADRIYTKIYYGFKTCLSQDDIKKSLETLKSRASEFESDLYKDPGLFYDDSIFLSKTKTPEILEESLSEGETTEKETLRSKDLQIIAELSKDILVLVTQNKDLEDSLKELEAKIEPLQTKKRKRKLPIERRPVLKSLLLQKTKTSSQIKNNERKIAALEAEKQKLAIEIK